MSAVNARDHDPPKPEADAAAERRYMRRIEFNPRTEYHIEQFDLHGK